MMVGLARSFKRVANRIPAGPNADESSLAVFLRRDSHGRSSACANETCSRLSYRAVSP
jgi:hypothetical protein